MDHKAEPPQVDDEHIKRLEEAVFKPLETYRVGRNEIVAGTVAPSYISPLQGLQRLEKIMDEYVGGYSMFYVTSENLLNRGLEHSRYAHGGLFEQIGAEDLHQLQRAWELQHRILTAESVARHTGARARCPRP